MDEQEQTQPLYTEEDLQEPVDITTGDYQVIKAIAGAATQKTDIPTDINFENFVHDEWASLVPENNSADYEAAQIAAANNQPDIVAEAFRTIDARNKLQGEASAQNALAVKAKIKELADKAVENIAVNTPAVLINNTPQEIADKGNIISSRVTSQAIIDKAQEDGKKWLSGIAYEFLPIAAVRGKSLDNIAVKYGVPESDVGAFVGQSEVIDRLILAYQALPEEKKGEWATNLYQDIKDAWGYSDMMAGITVTQILTGAGVEDAALSDFLDRVSVVGTAASGIVALAKSGKFIKARRAINNASRTIAAAGGKSAIEAAETAKVAAAAAKAANIRAAGAVVGEITGLNTALDLAKLVSMNAAKVLPEAVSTAANNLQKTLRAPVEQLITDLKTTIAGKGIRSAEAVEQLTALQRTFSSANNPNIHTVDPFVLSADGTAITGRVLYKPADASAFLTKEAAETYAKAIPGAKVVPDTTNSGFLVEAKVKEDLIAKRDLLAKQLLAETLVAGKSVPTPTPAPKALTNDVRDSSGTVLSFATDIDKAAYVLGQGLPSPAEYKALKNWLGEQTGWTDTQITGHQEAVRKAVGQAISTAPANTTPRIASQIPEGTPLYKRHDQTILSNEFKVIFGDKTHTTVGNVSIGNNVPKGVLLPFMSKLNKMLGMEDHKFIVLDDATLLASVDPKFQRIQSSLKTQKYNAMHLWYGDNQSIIILKRKFPVVKSTAKEATKLAAKAQARAVMEDFAHEYGHAFEAHFSMRYKDTLLSAFSDFLKKKRITHTVKVGSTDMDIVDAFGPKALLEYRATTHKEAFIEHWVRSYMNGDTRAFKQVEAGFHKWAQDYNEFFAEQFTIWAFTDDVPTSVLGQAFKELVDGFKAIAAYVQDTLVQLGFPMTRVQADENIARMLNTHVNMFKAKGTIKPSLSPSISGTDVATLQKELDAVEEELRAIDDAEKGIKTGWLVEQNVTSKIDYTAIGKYTNDDIDSFTRFSFGDWALSTSSELYAQRVVGINQGSRYTKLLTNFVRPSVERLNKAERVALDNALVLGDKEGKVWTEAELAGLNLSNRARNAYYRVRALRDVMWQMRNDVAAKSLIKRGFLELKTTSALAEVKLFGKEFAPTEGMFVLDVESGKTMRVSQKYLEQAKQEGVVFMQLAEPVLIDNKYRKTLALKKGAYTTAKPEEVIPYRAGEYRRIYSDEYFVKIKRVHDVDGTNQEVTTTHRTAVSAKEAQDYVAAMRRVQDAHIAGKLDAATASRELEAYGWKPEQVLQDFGSGVYDDVKFDVTYNRMDDDYVNEAIGLSSSFSSKRGDKIMSVRGEDTVNTLSPLDSIAAEIGNTSYVASTTEWREANVIRWYNTFIDDLPASVKGMSPEEAFVHMLNHEGMYVGQSKRLQMAQKVQEYIISQLNIVTKEEKQYLGAMRLLSESIEGVGGGSKPIAKIGMFLRATKDYPTWARTISFHSFFALNPVQFFMQGMNAFNAVAISPLHGMKSAQASAMYALALTSDQESIWRSVAKANKLGTLGLGMNEDEFVEAVRAIRRSGLLDGLNTTTLYGAETGKYGMFNGLTRKLGAVSSAPFNAGEGYARLVSFDIARREYMVANPGSAWWTDDSLAKIIERQDDLTQNMTKANVANWQRGWKSIPTQFVQYQVKLMMNIVQSLLGNKRVFTRAEAARLLVAHTLVMGTAGSMMFPFAREIINDLVPEDMSEEERIYIQQGVVAGAIASLSEGEAKLALGSRFNTFRFYEELVQGIFDPEKNILEVVGGPSGFAAFRFLGGVGSALSIMAKAEPSMDSLQVALTEIGKNSFTAFNNVQKTRIALANYNQVMSNAGGAMYRVTDTEAWLLSFGIPPVAQEDLSIVYASSKEHKKEMDAAAKAVGYHAMMAITALNTKDDGSYKVHAAVVQAILNTYSGEDFKTLLSTAYKTEGFTQYERMLVDQMVKDWEVKDVLVDTGGVNK